MATNRDSQGALICVNTDVCPDCDLPALLRSKLGIASPHSPFWTSQVWARSTIFALFYLSTKYQKHNQTP